MTDKDKSKRIRAAGVSTGRLDSRSQVIYKVSCQGCGKPIQSDDDLSGVEYVKTKRGTELFFHSGCMCRVWQHMIC